MVLQISCQLSASWAGTTACDSTSFARAGIVRTTGTVPRLSSPPYMHKACRASTVIPLNKDPLCSRLPTVSIVHVYLTLTLSTKATPLQRPFFYWHYGSSLLKETTVNSEHLYTWSAPDNAKLCWNYKMIVTIVPILCLHCTKRRTKKKKTKNKKNSAILPFCNLWPSVLN